MLHFEVLSRVSNKEYDVDIDETQGRVIRCSCPDHTANGTPLCKHMVFVLTRRLHRSSFLSNASSRPHVRVSYTPEQFGELAEMTRNLLSRFAQARDEVQGDGTDEIALDCYGIAESTGASASDVIVPSHPRRKPAPLVPVDGVLRGKRKRVYDETESCVLCLDDMPTDQRVHQWCSGCECLWHAECFSDLVRVYKRTQRIVQCPCCRRQPVVVCAPAL